MDTFYPAETIRITAKDLTHSDSGSVTSGATVTIAVYNPDGSLYQTQTVMNPGANDDWWADFAAPSSAGQYTVKLTAVKSGATWKSTGVINVRPF
jgi:hypothetical protein